MGIPEQTKTYLSILFGLIAALIMAYFAVREPKFSCDNFADDFKENFSGNLILMSKKFGGGIATLSGIDLSTKNKVNNEDYTKWLIDNFDKFKIGDTIIKKKGKYTIIIKRKGQMVEIPFECDKVYKD